MVLSHVDEKGACLMVDVAGKSATLRRARASAFVTLRPETLSLITQGGLPKGDALAVARIAGIMAAKKTPELIPLCHPLPLSSARVELKPRQDGVLIEAEVGTEAQTGVEMEALTAASVAALALYDMVKAVDRGAAVSWVRLEEKSGGKSGPWSRKSQ